MKPSLEALDRYQRAHGWLGYPLAVRQKYSDDQGGYLAAAITYYGFFALFPLLLVLVSVLGFALSGHPRFEKSVVDSALGQLPVIGTELQRSALKGSALALGLGLAAALYAGMGVFVALENALAQLWGIPYLERPGFLASRLRALLLLLALGLGLLVTATLGEVATVGANLGVAIKAAAALGSALLDCGLFWLGFWLLAGGRVSWRALRGGAIAAGIAYECLQLLGGLYVHHVLEHASETYGTFAVVVGLLTWIYLTVHVALLAAEGDVVASKRLWPRSLSAKSAPTPADRLAWQLRTASEQRRRGEHIEVTLDP